MNGCNYFLPSGPRHLLLMAGLALEQAAASDNRLFFMEHTPARAVERYIEMIGQWSASPFSRTEVLEADYRARHGEMRSSSAKRAIKKAFRARNRSVLDAALAERAPDGVYVNIDDYYESQYLLHRSRQLNPARRAIYVEDGTSAYEHSFRNIHIRNIPKEWIRGLRYFPWWRPCPIPGASGWLDEGYVAFPELVQPALQRISLLPLPLERFLSAEMRELALIIGEGFGLDAAEFSRADVLVAVTNSKWSVLLPGYRETMQHICRELLAAGKRVAIKPHPGDKSPDPLGLEDHPNLYRVPAAIMFEVLAMLADNPRLVVIGDASTALVATKWLRPRARVVALRHDPEGIDGQYLERIFRGIGVEIETDHENLSASCLDRAGAGIGRQGVA